MNFLKNYQKIFHNYIKKSLLPQIQKKLFCALNMNMINLLLDKLKLVAESRNIRDYGNKSRKDLIKVLSEPKRKIKIDKKKLEETRKDFYELRHKFSKKETDKYRKSFYDIKTTDIFQHQK